MEFRLAFCLVSAVLAALLPPPSAAGSEAACAITRAPDRPFIPPSGYRPYTASDGRFFLGTPGLWTLVTPRWTLHGTGRKLPFFSQDFTYGKSEADPRLAIVARRLDSPEAIVWSKWANGAGPPYSSSPGSEHHPDDHGFMVTALEIPTPGCWEITARYTPTRDKIHTLTYTVWVQP